MKIFLITPAPKAPFSHKNIYSGLRLAFNRHPKIDIQCFTIDEVFKIKETPDFYFMLDHQHFHHMYKPLRTRAKVAIWLLEDPYEIDISERICEDVDVVFTMDSSGLRVRQETTGCTNIHLLPLGTNRNIFNKKGYEDQYYSDILLVGVAFPYRVKAARELAEYAYSLNLRLRLIGLWWNREKSNKKLMLYVNNKLINELQLAYFYSNAKIAIELNRDLNSHNDRRIEGETPGRCFNPLACKTFSITDVRKDLPDFFDIGKEVCVVNSPEEIVSLVDYYLNNENERLEIANNGFQRVMKDHTLDNRVNQIFETLAKY